jgi:hypothetical protein
MPPPAVSETMSESKMLPPAIMSKLIDIVLGILSLCWRTLACCCCCPGCCAPVRSVLVAASAELAAVASSRPMENSVLATPRLIAS